MSWKIFLRWQPALVMMLLIFLASNTPASAIPNFGLWDMVVKKSGHILGYALLAGSYWYGLRLEKNKWWLVLVLAVVYAMTDEFHQRFIPGRHSSWLDVFGFDGGGALLAILVIHTFTRPGSSKN